MLLRESGLKLYDASTTGVFAIADYLRGCVDFCAALWTLKKTLRQAPFAPHFTSSRAPTCAPGNV